MSNWTKLLEATRDSHLRQLGSHPILRLVVEGALTRGQYLAYLRETHHMVRHTPRMLALAAARCEDDRRGLRDWFLKEAQEENGHDLLCVKDIRNLGEDPDAVLAQAPGPGAWGLVTQSYYMATYGNPAGILGVASVTEGLGAGVAASMADQLVGKCGIPSRSVSFLRSHAGFDKQHVHDVEGAVDALATAADFAAVLQARRMTIFCYAQMLSDALASPHSADRNE